MRPEAEKPHNPEKLHEPIAGLGPAISSSRFTHSTMRDRRLCFSEDTRMHFPSLPHLRDRKPLPLLGELYASRTAIIHYSLYSLENHPRFQNNTSPRGNQQLTRHNQHYSDAHSSASCNLAKPSRPSPHLQSPKLKRSPEEER